MKHNVGKLSYKLDKKLWPENSTEPIILAIIY